MLEKDKRTISRYQALQKTTACTLRNLCESMDVEALRLHLDDLEAHGFSEILKHRINAFWGNWWNPTCPYDTTSIVMYVITDLLHSHPQRVRDCVEMAGLLVEKGADLNLTSLQGWTVLHKNLVKQNVTYASRDDRILILKNLCKMTKFLIKLKADPNRCTENGLTPLHSAIQVVESYRVCKLLIKYGARVNVCSLISPSNSEGLRLDNCGTTPLHEGIWACRQDIVKLLLNHKADIFAINTNGKNAFDCLCTVKANFDSVRPGLYPLSETNRLQQSIRTMQDYLTAEIGQFETLFPKSLSSISRMLQTKWPGLDSLMLTSINSFIMHKSLVRLCDKTYSSKPTLSDFIVL